ncbi:MAG: hypothetical protein LBS51_03335 [Oscillospiraceae bacterium]|jgi:hypothetical protein|nr:hypothetical protein [Oscillospiraceae bacterium]
MKEDEYMPLLQVRDFPEDIYKEITFEARRQNRTIAQQTIILIKKGLGEEISNKERRKLALERTFSRRVPPNAKIADYVRFVREDRER